MNNSIPLKKACQYSSDNICFEDVSLKNFVTTDNLLQNRGGITIASNLPPKGNSFPKYNPANILIANIRPYLKKIWYADKIGGCSSDILVFEVKKGYHPRFVYYSLFRDDFFIHAMKGSKGTKMPRGDKNHIMEFEIPDFDITNQKKIASVLSSLDSKIELNNRINAELDAMAKTLYDYWFVQFDFTFDFAQGKPDKNGKPYKSSGGKMVWNEELKREIPEGWGVTKMADWIDSDKSGDWGKEEPEGNFTKKVICIRGADIKGLNGLAELKPPVRYILEKNASKILNSHDLIIEISGGSPIQSTGRIAFITDATIRRFEDPLICSNFCKPISIKNKKFLYNFVHYWNNSVVFICNIKNQ